jgi:4-hydroxybenzoate polyprenyltransferase
MRDLWALARPEQWIKNVVVLAALIFSLRLMDPPSLIRASLTFVAFCLASSSAYAVNDVIDRDRDRLHPDKRDRPVAAGRISPRSALIFAGSSALASLGLASGVGPGVLASVGAFLGLQAAYSLVLKQVVGLDVVAIASGFVLRTAGGVVAVGAHMSKWLFVCTFGLALFLALAKRRQELVLLQDDRVAHRDSLAGYGALPLDTILALSGLAVLGVYAQYTLSPDVEARLGTDSLYLTVPFVVLGLFRYLLLVYRRDLVGNPTSALLNDRPLQLSVALWAATVLVLLYG